MNEKILSRVIDDDNDKSHPHPHHNNSRFDKMRSDRYFVAKQIVRIIVGYLSCSLASGVLTAWPTLVELLEADKVFSEGCANSPMGKVLLFVYSTKKS